MGRKSSRLFLVSILALLAIVSASCTPAIPSPEGSTKGTPDLIRGGKAIMLIAEEPPSLNLYLTETGTVTQIADASIDGLVKIGPDGNYFPALVIELPSQENGGVSKDLLTITWKIKPGLKWSDGKPVTSDDIKFTWEAVSAPNSGALQTGGFDLIDKIDTPDAQTAIVHYKKFYVGYLGQFRWGIFPRHATGKADEMTKWDWNRKPVTTGPFVVSEWRTGDRIIMKANPYYRENGKPYLDELEFQIVPDYQSQLAMMKNGEAHGQRWPSETKADYDKFMAGHAQEYVVPGLWNMELNFNLSMPFDNEPGPLPPHPILGDLRVRQAIAYGIDYEYIIKDVMHGEVSPSYSPFEYGWYKCDMERPYPTDKNKAIALLDEAGWKDTNGDGIRECEGCKYADKGSRMRLQLLGYNYDDDLQRTEEAIVEQMKAIGIEVYIQNEDFSVIFGGWSDHAPRKTGDFDMQIYDGLVETEPQDTIISQWRSDQIPNAQKPDGRNYFRWVDSKADAYIDAAGISPDLNIRKDAYCKLAKEMSQQLPVMYLYLLKDSTAYSNKLHGFQVSTWGSLTWDAANWWIEH